MKQLYESKLPSEEEQDFDLADCLESSDEDENFCDNMHENVTVLKNTITARQPFVDEDGASKNL